MNKLYQPDDIERALHGPHFRQLPDAQVEFTNHNHMCGDDLTLYLKLEDGGLQGSFLGRCCIVCRTSANLMLGAVTGEAIVDARALIGEFLKTTEPPTRIVPFEEFWANLKDFPTRHKCATFPWLSLAQALDLFA